MCKRLLPLAPGFIYQRSITAVRGSPGLPEVLARRGKPGRGPDPKRGLSFLLLAFHSLPGKEASRVKLCSFFLVLVGTSASSSNSFSAAKWAEHYEKEKQVAAALGPGLASRLCSAVGPWMSVNLPGPRGSGAERHPGTERSEVAVPFPVRAHARASGSPQ